MTEEAIVASMFVVIALIIGMVSIAKPLIARLGDILESYLAAKTGEAELQRGLEAVQDQVERVSERLSLMEERLDFTESLVARGRPRELPAEVEEAGATGEVPGGTGSPAEELASSEGALGVGPPGARRGEAGDG